MQIKKNNNRLFCFSPPVMVATFVIEIGLALYTLWRYRRNRLTWLIVAMLVFLAIFQAAEFMVCGKYGMSALVWSRIGYAAITVLPAVGLHIAYEITKVKPRLLLVPVYALAAAFVAFFLFGSSALTGNQCMGNYVIFQAAPWAVPLYMGYYYGLLIITMLLTWFGGQKLRDGRRRKAAHGFIGGYALFIIPTIAVWALSPEVVSGIPSIMCGFAVMLALVLVLYVLPRAAHKNQA